MSKRKQKLVHYHPLVQCPKCGRTGASTSKWHNANLKCFGRPEEHIHTICMCGFEMLFATFDSDGMPDVRILLKSAASKARERVTQRIIDFAQEHIKDETTARTICTMIRRAVRPEMMDVEVAANVIASTQKQP